MKTVIDQALEALNKLYGMWTKENPGLGFVEDAITLLEAQKAEGMGEVSDGYHTFNELYRFRKLYNAALFNEWAATGKFSVHKSKRHHDGEECFGGGWFIVVAVLPDGQISNHYEMSDWELFKIPEAEKAIFRFDGHYPSDVADRLESLTSQPATDSSTSGERVDANMIEDEIFDMLDLNGYLDHHTGCSARKPDREGSYDNPCNCGRDVTVGDLAHELADRLALAGAPVQGVMSDVCANCRKSYTAHEPSTYACPNDGRSTSIWATTHWAPMSVVSQLPAPSVTNVSRELMEALAADEHDRWAGQALTALNDMTDERRERWARLAKIPYADLDEKNKELDRMQVRERLAIMAKFLPPPRLAQAEDGMVCPDDLCKAVNENSDFQWIVYDMGLMPEQIKTREQVCGLRGAWMMFQALKKDTPK